MLGGGSSESTVLFSNDLFNDYLSQPKEQGLWEGNGSKPPDPAGGEAAQSEKKVNKTPRAGLAASSKQWPRTELPAQAHQSEISKQEL